ncbi:hypothetical protein L0666_08745 [Octadecabacter sp. CECT 8868]|uniref:hypothetical protein n=1 Tax=Octadecabacter algicola TaxID=2909342 RepID=UPI001F2FD55F|nr:hypothetical protein [Octadecabacter algicola]MCF2905073.1 hypothetical protein [Octadecabacter algicola]
MRRFPETIAGLFAAVQLLIGCTQVASIANNNNSDSFNECSGKDGFIQAQYEFYEPWMDEYSIWVRQIEAEVPVLEVGGKIFSLSADNLAVVQIYRGSTRCIFEIETATFQVSSLGLYLSTFTVGALSPAAEAQIRNLRSSIASGTLDAAIHLSASIYDDRGARNAISFLILDGEFFSLN